MKFGGNHMLSVYKESLKYGFKLHIICEFDMVKLGVFKKLL